MPILGTNKYFIVLVGFLLISLQLSAQHYTISVDHEDGNYKVGETVLFKVASNISTDVTYVITRGKYTDTLQTGALELQSGDTEYVSYSTAEPGNLFLIVKNSWTEGIGGAIVGADDIAIFENEPTDFDAYWTGVKNELQQVPMEAKVSFHKDMDYSKAYTVKLGNIDGRKVYGMLHVPEGDGPFPAIVELPAYGSGKINGNHEFAQRTNCLVLAISIHDAPVTTSDPEAYNPNDPTDRDLMYYKHSVTAGVRAIDYLFSRDDFNGNDIAVIGESQGAGLALLVAGVDSRVNLLGIASPALCSHAGLLHGHSSGFPSYLQVPLQVGNQEEINKTRLATSYYEGATAAKRFKGNVLMLTSYDDDVTMPETQFTATNNLDGKKILIHNLSGGHNDRPYFTEGQKGIFRRYFSNTDNPPFPWADEFVGYDVSAGPDKLVIVNEPISLVGKIEKELQENPDFPVSWRVMSGPGTVSFGNKNQYTTTATFSQAGKYMLEFKGKDIALLADEGVYYTLSDRIIINVQAGTNPAPTVTLSTPITPVSSAFEVTATFSENISNLSLDDFEVINGNASNLSGNGMVYTISVEPMGGDTVKVMLPADVVEDDNGTGNIKSNLLKISYVDEANPKIDLALAMEVDNASVEKYEPITFTMVLSNVGTSQAHNIEVDCKLPLGLVYVVNTSNSGSYDSATGIWSLEALPHSTTATLTVVAKLNTNMPTTYFIQVTMADELDNDSTPNNNASLVPVEDDEAAKTVLVKGVEPPQYCEPSLQANSEWIQRFVFQTIDHASGQDSYGDFTNNLTTVKKGQPLDFSIEPKFSTVFSEETYSIWIDFDQNGVFSTDEQVFQLQAPAPKEITYPILGSIVIPTAAKEGITRLRVVMNRGKEVLDPCLNSSFGEVEDYTVFIENISVVPHVLDFNVVPFQGGAQSNWVVNNVAEGAKFVLEKTLDGDFFAINTKEYSQGNAIYDFWDVNPDPGMNYYRLKLIGNSGLTEYSKIESIYFEDSIQIEHESILFPSLTTGIFRIDLADYEGLDVRFYLTNTLGQVVRKWPTQIITADLIPFDISYLHQGMYFFNIKIKSFVAFSERLYLTQ